jgi:hypothetical protein
MMPFEEHIIVIIRDNPFMLDVSELPKQPSIFFTILILNFAFHFIFSAKLQMSVTAIDPAIGVTPLPMRFRKATKQLATLGPASSSFEMIEKLFLSGNDSSPVYNDSSPLR